MPNETLINVMSENSKQNSCMRLVCHLFLKTQFYESKKRIPMTGRIIGGACGEEVGSPVLVSEFSTPIHSPVPIRPKCLPRQSTMDEQGLRFFSIKLDSCNELLKSKCENRFDL